MNHTLKCKKKYIKLLENENIGHNLWDPVQIGFWLPQNLKLVHCKIPCKEAGKASYRLGEVFANHIPSKELISRIYKELSKHNNKKTNYSVCKRPKVLNRHFTKEDI